VTDEQRSQALCPAAKSPGIFFKRALSRLVVVAVSLCAAAGSLPAASGDAFLNAANFASLGSFNPTTNVVVDLKLGVMTGGASFAGVGTTQAGTPLLVFTFSSFTLNAGVTVTFTNDGSGSPAAAFLSQGDMRINGIIYGCGQPANYAPTFSGGRVTLNPVIGVGGPGGGNGGSGLGAGGTLYQGSGAGGGGGGYGGAGGTSWGGAQGGTTYNSDLSSQLMGGSGGGNGDASGAYPGLGGAGGGALQFGALGSVTISGTINVMGFPGLGSLSSSKTGQGGGGGGGSGGGILIHAGNVVITPSAYVTAQGFSGGVGVGPNPLSDGTNSGAGGGGGRIYIGYRYAGVTNGNIFVDGGESWVGSPQSAAGANGTLVFAQHDLVPANPIEPLNLDLTLIPGNQIRLSWPAFASNYLLETSLALGPTASWSPFETGIVTNGNNYTTTISNASGSGFFRLRLPP